MRTTATCRSSLPRSERRSCSTAGYRFALDPTRSLIVCSAPLSLSSCAYSTHLHTNDLCSQRPNEKDHPSCKVVQEAPRCLWHSAGCVAGRPPDTHHRHAMRRVPIEARFAFSCQSIGFETHTPLLTVSRRVPPDKLRIEGLFRVSGNKDMVEKLKLEYKNPNRTSDDADNGSRTHDLAYALTPPCYLVYRHSRHGQVQECARHRHDAQASTYTTIQFVVSRSLSHSFIHSFVRPSVAS